MLPHPLHAILVHAVVENASLVSVLQQFGHDISIELRVTLHCDQALLLVHALHVTSWRVTQMLDRGRVGVDDVAVHLVDGLESWMCQSGGVI